jgi:hypothetical protein
MMSKAAADNRNRANSGNDSNSSSGIGDDGGSESPLTILADETEDAEEEAENSICAGSDDDESSTIPTTTTGVVAEASKDEQVERNQQNRQNHHQQQSRTSEASFLGTFGSPGGEDDNDSSAASDNNAEAIDTNKIVSWTETLQTPSTLGAAIFLPSTSTTTTTLMMDPNSSSNSKAMESCRHGLGLQLAVNRTQHVNKYNRKCVALLLDATTAYDHYASQLIKAGQALQPAIHIVAQQSQTLLLTTTNSKRAPNILALQEAMVSWSGEVSKLSAILRTGIAQPLNTFLASAHADAVTAVYSRYNTSRQNCVLLHQRMVAVRNRHSRLVREVEMLLLADESKKQLQQQIKKSTSWTSDGEEQREVQATTGGSSGAAGVATATSGGPADASGALASSKRLIGKLRDVRRVELKYKRLVQWEADCVATCQRLEHMALETLQNMEEHRLYLFVWSLLKTLASFKQAIDKLVVALREHQEQGLQQNQVQNQESSPERSSVSAAPSGSTIGSGLGNNGMGSSSFDTGIPAGESRNRTMSFVKMLTLSTSSGHGVGGGGGCFGEADEGMATAAAGAGCMDAETLGLPEEIGKLRDATRAKLITRRERVHVAKILSIFLDSVSKASTKLGNALKHHHHRKESGSNNNSSTRVPDATNSGEGTRAARLWNGVVSFIETEADGSLALAESLRSLRGSKLDALVAEKEKAVKSAFDADDATWKQLCEAARAHLKAESRYRQSSAESAKARVRVNSFDNEKNKQQPNNLKVGKHVSKGKWVSITILCVCNSAIISRLTSLCFYLVAFIRPCKHVFHIARRG